MELAAQWHDQTYRKSMWRDPAFDPPLDDMLRVPVMAHVTNVALQVQRAGWDDATVAAAFLHDVIEDANKYHQSMRRHELEALMGTEVTRLVQDVTEQKYTKDGDPRPWKARKEGYIAHLEHHADPRAVGISLADKLHNLWTMCESLEQGLDIFSSTPTRRGLSAGPGQQLWFHQAVLTASEVHDDPRLERQRDRLQRELERFIAQVD